MSHYSLHFMHHDGRFFGDAMPYFYQGQYHLFYLLNGSGHNDINHEHAVSTDLIHWTQLPPSIYHEDNCAFTGSYMTTPDGIHHCFFTRWKEGNPAGRESIGHATSTDMIHWTKTPLHLIPDGVIYSSGIYRDFRDPCVFFDEKQNLYHMILLANAAGNDNGPKSWDEHWIQGHYVSKDLVNWEPQKPFEGNFADECPDYFHQQNRHYLHGCHHYGMASSFQGPYQVQPDSELDLGARAPKFCFDGKRRVWFAGFIGGPATLPRVLSVLPDGQLGLSFAPEVIDAVTKRVQLWAGSEGTLALIPHVPNRFRILGSHANQGTLKVRLDPMNRSLLFDFSSSRVTLLEGDRPIKETGIGKQKTLTIDLIVDHDIVEVLWNDFRAFSGKCEGPAERLLLEGKGITLSVDHFRG